MNKFLVVTILVLLFSCNHSFLEDGDYFHLKSDNAVMPVWVRGNSSSGTYVLYIHGGPGGSGIAEATVEAFSGIEEEYNLVYWDQRAGGITDGNPAKINNELIADDLDLLIDTINKKYKAEKIVLMGHSYGVVTICSYISSKERREKIDYIIYINGVANLKGNWENSVNWVKKKTSSQNTLNWYSGLDNKRLFTTNNMVKRHLDYVDKLGGMYYRNPSRIDPSIEQVLFSPISLSLFSNEKECSKRFNNWWESDFSEVLKYINFPVLVIAGRYDGIFPVESVDDFYLSINTTNKYRVMYEESGHHPHFEETHKFNKDVIGFLKNNNYY